MAFRYPHSVPEVPRFDACTRTYPYMWVRSLRIYFWKAGAFDIVTMSIYECRLALEWAMKASMKGEN